MKRLVNQLENQLSNRGFRTNNPIKEEIKQILSQLKSVKYTLFLDMEHINVGTCLILFYTLEKFWKKQL